MDDEGLTVSNVKPLPDISPATVDRIIAWLDAKREGPAPVDPAKQVRVYTLPGLAVVFIGEQEAEIFEDAHG